MANERVLIVEDQSIVAMDMELTLRILGYRVVGVARTGPEALTKAHALLPDVVLMDIRLEGQMDGIETTRQIRQSYTRLPVIYVTANTDPDTLERARETQPSGFINKPFTERILKEVITHALIG